MRVRATLAAGTVLALVTWAAGGIGVDEWDAALEGDIRYRRGLLAAGDSAAEDRFRIRTLDRASKRLQAGFRSRLPGRIRASVPVTRMLRRAFPDDAWFEYYLQPLPGQFDSVTRLDRDSLARAIDLLPPGATRDLALPMFDRVDRLLEAAEAHPDFLEPFLARACKAILAAEAAASGGGGDRLLIRLPGQDRFSPENLDVFDGWTFVNGPRGSVVAQAKDSQREGEDPESFRVRPTEIYMQIGPPIDGPGVYDIASGGLWVDYDRVSWREWEGMYPHLRYRTAGSGPDGDLEPRGTLTIRTWFPGAGIVDGSFSCTLYRERAEGPFASAGEEIEISGEFRFTEI